MASLLGVCQPSNKIETKPIISGENRVENLEHETKSENKTIIDSRTIMMSRMRQRKNRIKSETIVAPDNVIGIESKTVENPVSSKTVVLGSQAFVKSTVAQKLDSKSSFCDLCSKTLNGNKRILKAHMRAFHPVDFEKISRELTPRHIPFEKRLVTCATCGKDNPDKKISRHEKLCRMSEAERAAYNATLKVECEECHKIFSQKHKLARHMKTVHSTSKLFQCEHCDHRDNRSDNMKTHIKNNHSEMDPKQLV